MSESSSELESLYEAGLEFEKSGDIESAVDAYQRVLQIDPADHGGVAVRMAALQQISAPERASEAYVSTLFNQQAAAFEHILVDQLQYHVPEQIRDLIEPYADRPFTRMLDLGCGTGLMGAQIYGFGDYLAGVDLAQEMLSEADDKETYDDLYIGDAEGFLIADGQEAPEMQWDLILAADMLPYLGTVTTLFDAVAERLIPQGLFVFSTETLPEEAFEGNLYCVNPHQRFAHHPERLAAQLLRAGLVVLKLQEITVRLQEGIPAKGHIFLVQKPLA